jgi:hypothetical protein
MVPGVAELGYRQGKSFVSVFVRLKQSGNSGGVYGVARPSGASVVKNGNLTVFFTSDEAPTVSRAIRDLR